MRGVTRALAGELALNRDYLWKLALMWVFVAATLSLGLGTLLPVPGLLVLTTFISVGSNSSMQDDANRWAAFRLCGPLTRRDVVVGRFLYVLLIALAAVGVGVAMVALMASLGVHDKSALSRVLGAGDVAVITTATAALFCYGSLFGVVNLTCHFAMGATGTARWLPTIMVLLCLAPFVASGFSPAVRGALQAGMGWLMSPGMLVPFSAGCVAASLALLAVGVVLSDRLYARRDL